MASKRLVSEQDFRKPEFVDAKVEDYEFRDDGALVRKDRWMTAIHQIASIAGHSTRREFEIADVVSAVKEMATQQEKFGVAIDFARGITNGFEFLRLWVKGYNKTIREDWNTFPEAYLLPDNEETNES